MKLPRNPTEAVFKNEDDNTEEKQNGMTVKNKREKNMYHTNINCCCCLLLYT